MFAMRLKLGSIRNNEWRCWICCHVRSATIAFGIWHLILHVLALTVLALVMRNHHVIVQKHDEFQQNDFLPTPLSNKEEDNPYYLPTTQDGRTIYSSDIDMGALMTVCTLSITLLMVYGTIKGKATHVLPFFCLQLFDFAITTLTATGYFCYLRSVHRLVAEHWNLPLRHELLQLSPLVLSLIILLLFVFSMLWKAYWISVVWRCYKFLTLRQQTIRNTIHYILPGEGDRANDSDFPSLFRDHEAAFGSAMKQTPPPSYQDIMDDQPPPYPSTMVSQVVQETPNRFRLFAFLPNNTEEAKPLENAATINEPTLTTSTSAVATNSEEYPRFTSRVGPEETPRFRIFAILPPKDPEHIIEGGVVVEGSNKEEQPLTANASGMETNAVEDEETNTLNNQAAETETANEEELEGAVALPVENAVDDVEPVITVSKSPKK